MISVTSSRETDTRYKNHTGFKNGFSSFNISGSRKTIYLYINILVGRKLFYIHSVHIDVWVGILIFYLFLKLIADGPHHFETNKIKEIIIKKIKKS